MPGRPGGSGGVDTPTGDVAQRELEHHRPVARGPRLGNLGQVHQAERGGGDGVGPGQDDHAPSGLEELVDVIDLEATSAP